MKKIILSFVLLAAVQLWAADHAVQSFLTTRAVLVGTNSWGMGITNLNAKQLFTGYAVATNKVGTVFTNEFGTAVTVTNTAADAMNQNKNLLGSVVLPRSSSTNNPAPAAIFIRMHGTNAAAVGTIMFRFAPQVGDHIVTTVQGYMDVPVNGLGDGVPVMIHTNVPCWKFAGFEKLALVSITEQSAGDNTFNCWVTDVDLVGYLP